VENSIEEAIKVMEHWIEYEKNNKEKINRADELINIQETILSAYKRVLKEKNRLEEQVEYDKTHIYTPQTIELNFISKSKIEDKIEKLNSESYAEKLEDMMNTKNYTITELVQYVLQELLDGSDTDVGSIGNSIEEDMKYIHKTLNDMKIKDEDAFMSAVATIFRDYKRVLKENEKLKNIRYDTPYGTETIHLILESNLIEINTHKYMIEVEPGKFVDLKQVYLENKKLNEYKENYIPIQKIKDKIEELDKKVKDYQCVENRINLYQRKVLQELLEESEE